MPTKVTFHLSLTNPSTLFFSCKDSDQPLEIKEEGSYLNVYVASTSQKLGGVQASLVLWHEGSMTAPQS